MEHGQPNQNRVIAIDAIRGIALFGILMVNLLSFHSPHFLYGGKEDFYDNGSVLAVIDIFFQASFYPLFSMLFGLGMYMMYERLQEKGLEQKPILVRRMVILAVFGLVHGIFIWYGDIMLVYGIIGLISLVFINKSSASLKKWAFGFLIVVTVIMSALSFGARELLDTINQAKINQSFTHYQGDFSSILQQNVNDWVYMNNPFQWIIIFLNILPMFLFGMMIQKRGWVRDLSDHRKDIKTWLIGTFAIFVVFKVGPYLFGMPTWLNSAQDMIGGSFSSIFYFLLFLVLINKRNVSLITRILSNVGRLSLTNYIMQSLLGVLIFYGIGFNLYGSLTAFELILVAILIFSFQMLFSYWYVKYFRYGPLEWVYRSLTYRERQPMLKKGD
ncbi:DUF418 domain-containing protein [Filobacillus milosensis]|uniref:DUF418 domain-containing protein n=1 Tax=Filobacillus milosensis TaxID=94137 RepID=A0A4Y8ILD4_9BACI|nr:DUF418 domain-containing protein [Filobacillus milosensis]TFB22053.1 DUF418 domain-containing protein [Filobacillus milosensis]